LAAVHEFRAEAHVPENTAVDPCGHLIGEGLTHGRIDGRNAASRCPDERAFFTRLEDVISVEIVPAVGLRRQTGLTDGVEPRRTRSMRKPTIAGLQSQFRISKYVSRVRQTRQQLLEAHARLFRK